MKKLIFTGIAIIACVTLCAAVWPRNAGVEDLPAELNKNAVIGEIEARLEGRPPILLSTDTRTPELEAVAESKPIEIDRTAEEKMKSISPAESTPVTPTPTTANIPASSSPKSGDRTIIDGKPHIWVQGFGWVKDEGVGSVGIPVHGEGDINKQIGVMGGGTTIGNQGDKLTGNKVGIMGGDDAQPSNTDPTPSTKKHIDGKPYVWVPGFGWIEYSDKPNVGIVAEDMYENGHKIGIMGGGESTVKDTTPPPVGQPEPTVDEIHIMFVEVPEKNSTPPPYKPDTTSP